jgi:hypothetical protein
MNMRLSIELFIIEIGMRFERIIFKLFGDKTYAPDETKWN